RAERTCHRCRAPRRSSWKRGEHENGRPDACVVRATLYYCIFTAMPSAIFRDGDDLENATAVGGADLAGAGVFDLEALGTRQQAAKDGRGDVVSAVLAGGVAAGQDEQRRRRVDDMADVARLDHDRGRAALLDLEAERDEVRNSRAQPRRLVFTAAPLSEPFC